MLAFPQRNFPPCRLYTSVVFATQRSWMFKQSKLPNMRLRKYIKHLNIFIVSLSRSYRFERATWPVSIPKNPTLWPIWRQQIKYTQGQQSCVNLIFSATFGDPKSVSKILGKSNINFQKWFEGNGGAKQRVEFESDTWIFHQLTPPMRNALPKEKCILAPKNGFERT